MQKSRDRNSPSKSRFKDPDGEPGGGNTNQRDDGSTDGSKENIKHININSDNINDDKIDV